MATTKTRQDEQQKTGRRLPDDELKRALYLLKLCRYFDERMEALYRQGRLPGAIYSGRGQEGTHIGVVLPLRAEDSLFPTHRDLSAQIAKGLDLKRIMAQFWGRIDGYTRGRDGNSHIGDWYGNKTWTVMSHLPIAYPVACGAALAYKRRGEPNVAMAICGDGSTSNGRWHESLNMSAIAKLPVVWVVNNNLYAYSTPNELEFPVPTVAERAAAYGMPGVRVDGADVLAVEAAAREAVERARSGGGPSLIESVSLRWKGHAGHDPAKYVPKELLEDYMKNKDPVKHLESFLKSEGVVTEQDVADIQARIEKEFEEGYEFAQASPFPEPGDHAKGLWVEDGYWTSEPGRGGGTNGVRLMAEAATVEAGAAGHGAEPRGKRTEDGQATYLVAIAEALWEEMERDERVYMMGEDIGVYGGAFKVTEGFYERFGGERVMDTPIAEETIVGMAIGSAMEGLPPDRGVPVRRLHVERVRHDLDRSRAGPLPQRRPAAGRAPGPIRRHGARLLVPLDQPGALVLARGRDQGDRSGVPRRRQGLDEVRDPRRQPRDVPGAQVDLPAHPRAGARGPGLPRPDQRGRRQA